MARHRTLAQFELFVMIAIDALGDQAWSVAIGELIEERCGRKTSLGAVYITLKRLQDKGLIETSAREGQASGGRQRNYYSLTVAGRDELRATTSLVTRMMAGAPTSGRSR